MYDSLSMQRLHPGMAVFGIRGRRVGKVGTIYDDCFEVVREKADGGPICLTPESIFTVEARDVTLVCEKTDVERYRCPQHTPA